MDKFAEQKTAAQFLYPSIEPFDRRMMDVGDGHTVYMEQSGNHEGRPVVVLHGGPGGGCSPAMRRYFDPEHYRIILNTGMRARATTAALIKQNDAPALGVKELPIK
ncbi:MAG: hypothetical protein AAFR02_07355, partial [Pseudomonadota bacterium]